MGLLTTLGLAPKPGTTPPPAGLPAAPTLARNQAGPAADDAKRELSDLRADVDAIVTQITALVLGGITRDAARKRINDELTTLKAAVAKAGKVADRSPALKALNAVLGAAQALLQRAQAAKNAIDLAQASLDPLAAAAATTIGSLAAAAKAVLQRELDALKADIARLADAGDSAALQATALPRLKRLAGVAAGIGPASTQADTDIARAAQLVLALDPAASGELRARLKALQELKKSAWPAGNSLDEIERSVGAATQGAKSLIADAEALKSKLALDREIAAVRKHFDALKPRVDKASEAPVPAFIDLRQKNVATLVAALESQLAASLKAPAEKSLATLVKALDDLEKFKALHAAHRARFEAAKNGPIKQALAVKLAPPDLAASRDKAIAAREREIEAMTVHGVFGPADSAIERWVIEAKAWASAKEAYDNLHSAKPKVGKLEDLADKPGGGPVLDALVADLPPDTTPQEVFTAAMKARWGVDVEQFEHRKDGGRVEDPDKKTRVDPNTPDKDLQGLYKVLGQVPVKDVKHVEKINRFTKDKESATYTGGVFTDTIALHCGRPGGPEKTNFNVPGEVMPLGESVDPNCAPLVPGDTAPWFDFTVMHEVGHAVDDARNIMDGDRAKDAGWDSLGTGSLSKKIAAHVGYDDDYIEDMLDDAASTPPKKAPKPPKGTSQADWDKARVKAENFVKAIRVGKELWGDASSAKAHAIAGRVYHEAYDGSWVGYNYAARSKGITGYQFRAPAEWFAELYAAFYSGKLNPKHTAASWLHKLKAESNAR